MKLETERKRDEEREIGRLRQRETKSRRKRK